MERREGVARIDRANISVRGESRAPPDHGEDDGNGYRPDDVRRTLVNHPSPPGAGRSLARNFPRVVARSSNRFARLPFVPRSATVRHRSEKVTPAASASPSADEFVGATVLRTRGAIDGVIVRSGVFKRLTGSAAETTAARLKLDV